MTTAQVNPIPDGMHSVTQHLVCKGPMSCCGDGTSGEMGLRRASAPFKRDQQVSSHLMMSNPLILRINP